MEYLDGVRLVDGIRESYRKLAERKGSTLEELEEEERRAALEHGQHLQSLEEKKREARSIERALVVATKAQNAGRWLYNWSLAWIPGIPPLEYVEMEKPINLGEILELLLEVHGYEVMVNGAFNGDPHPGNILLLKDGRLGLVDYGQVKRFTNDQRIAYAKLVVALAEDDRNEIVRVLRDEMGVRTRHNNEEILYKLACFWNDRETDDITGGRHMQAFLDWAESVDPIVDPGDFIMASRMSMLLRGMGRAFGLQLRSSKAWEHIAREKLVESAEQ